MTARTKVCDFAVAPWQKQSWSRVRSVRRARFPYIAEGQWFSFAFSSATLESLLLHKRKAKGVEGFLVTQKPRMVLATNPHKFPTRADDVSETVVWMWISDIHGKDRWALRTEKGQPHLVVWRNAMLDFPFCCHCNFSFLLQVLHQSQAAIFVCTVHMVCPGLWLSWEELWCHSSAHLPHQIIL